MELAETEIHSRLLSESEEFRALVEQHRAFEDRLEDLTGRRRRSERHRLEQIKLKKRKLQLKDRMAVMIRDYVRSHETVGA